MKSYEGKKERLEISLNWIIEVTYRNIASLTKGSTQSLVEKDFCELTMSKWEGPKSEVTSSVRNSSKGILDSLDHLMNKQLSKSVLLFIFQWHIHAPKLIRFIFLVIILVNLVRSRVVTWLNQKHKWSAEECNNDTELHDLCLVRNKWTPLQRFFTRKLIVDTTTKEHDNHGHDYTWWL